MYLFANDFFSLSNALSTSGAILPIAGGIAIGLAITLLRSPAGTFSKSQPHSLMNFSSNGTLHCICGEVNPDNPHPDRRHVCRACGCEVVILDPALMEKPLTSKEIRTLTRSLRQAAMRASNLELPPSITTIDHLNEYLTSSLPKLPRTTKPLSAIEQAVEQPTVH